MSTRKRNKLGNDPLGWMDDGDEARSGTSDEPPQSEASGSDDTGDPGDAAESEARPARRRAPAKSRSRKNTGSARTETPQQASSEDSTMAEKTQNANASEERLDGEFMRAACEGSRMSVMMCDPDMNIIYANQHVMDLLTERKQQIRQRFPDFDPENLVGQSIDQFHVNPAHQRAILQNPDRLPWTANIEVGGIEFQLKATAVVDDEGNYRGNMVEWSDTTEFNRAERERARFAAAIDGAEAALMMCDEDMNVTFANQAVQRMFERHQATFARHFAGFDPRNLVGQSIDRFHENPAHQRSILQNPERLPHEAEIALDDLRFRINATAIIDARGNYAGNMLEWQDVTEVRHAEEEIASLIENAASGNLGERLDPEQYSGFTRVVGEKINGLLDAVVPPLREGSRVMQAMSEGDLTARMEGDFQGEFAEFRDAIHDTMDNLDRLVGQILEGAHNVRSASSEIAQGNTDLSQRTEEQASSLEETASSMEEMTSTVKSNADNSKQANQLAVAARDKAAEGGEVVGKAVDAMGEINQSSKKISDIIGVIDEIAFQTNLLALNAAVEAARAGEQGRGFAVVATEVRNLAQRSAQAAKEIKSLISDSVEKVDEGTKLVDASGKALEEIVDSVKKVSDIIAEIAAASEQQSTGLDEINKAVSQLDEVTQQNAALVEEAASAS
ncbi:methyl-accepting chemotaxis protein, partial [Thioalkalivibrio sp. ALE19]|uniref:methyl-accepting chemotaxis protein n=1 Tax=Thioalkalivibrio sp. ALE19 TaxID=1266909 RepID=UPI0004908272